MAVGPAVKSGIFHLVRKANGLKPFEVFLKSFAYLSYSDEVQLVFIFKGFADADDCRLFLELCKGYQARHVFVSDEGFDITAYFKAVEEIDVDYILLFNSFSEILSPDCFQHMSRHIQKAGVGMVGATGSFESPVSSYYHIIKNERSRFRRWLRYGKVFYLSLLFPYFPNRHLRTNAIMLRRADFLAAKRKIRSKMQALRFESGRRGLSRFIEKRGLKLLLIDRMGNALASEEWSTAAVFRDRYQENLLVADNQTRAYLQATEQQQRELRVAAWGSSASAE